MSSRVVTNAVFGGLSVLMSKMWWVWTILWKYFSEDQLLPSLVGQILLPFVKRQNKVVHLLPRCEFKAKHFSHSSPVPDKPSQDFYFFFILKFPGNSQSFHFYSHFYLPKNIPNNTPDNLDKPDNPSKKWPNKAFAIFCDFAISEVVSVFKSFARFLLPFILLGVSLIMLSFEKSRFGNLPFRRCYCYLLTI